MDSESNTTRSFVEVDMDIIKSLKAKGFKNIQFDLQLTDDRVQATVEIVPTKGGDFELSSEGLNSYELKDYFEGRSPMARYVIDRGYLEDLGVGFQK